MFIKTQSTIIPIKNTTKLKMVCTNCNNDVEHEIFEEPYGFCVGIVFLKRPLLSLRRYWFVCPICKNGTKQLTKEQVNAYKIK